jgi:hypothetical protein
MMFGAAELFAAFVLAKFSTYAFSRSEIERRIADTFQSKNNDA